MNINVSDSAGWHYMCAHDMHAHYYYVHHDDEHVPCEDNCMYLCGEKKYAEHSENSVRP